MDKIVFLIILIVGIALGYLISVGIVWLIFTLFGLNYNIWLGGLVWIIAINVLRSIFGSKNEK